MSDKDDLISALHAADAAGDADAAQHFATVLAGLPADKPAPAPKLVAKPKQTEQERVKAASPSAYEDIYGKPPDSGNTVTLAKGAWNGLNSLSQGFDQIASNVKDPIVSAIGHATGQDFDTDIARNRARMASGRQATQSNQESLEKDSPIDAKVGNAIPAMALGGPLTPELGIAGAGGRLANTMVGAGAQGMLEPVDDNSSFGRQKAEQFGLGAALGGVVHGLGELGSAAKGFVNRHILFGDAGEAASPIQKYWQKAKDMGFNISPQQARQDAGRIQTPGVTYTQREQNRVASNLAATKPTGMPSGIVDKDYLGSGFREVGKDYDKIYGPGTNFKVDGHAISQLQDFVDNSPAAQLGSPWANKEAMAAANKLLDAYHSVVGSSGTATNVKMNVDGPTLNRLVSELKSSSAKIRYDFQREDLGEVINSINESVARNNPAAKAALDVANPKYRTLKTLEVLSHNGGIDANGNVDPMAVAKLLRRSDKGYARGSSTHPLNDLATVGEVYGIRAPSQPTVAGGRMTSGVDVPTSRAGFLQKAVESGKEHLPGFQAGFNRYKMGESGRGLDRSEQQTISGMVSAAEASQRQDEDTHR